MCSSNRTADATGDLATASADMHVSAAPGKLRVASVSSYEKYDETSRHYDMTRVAVGGEIILGCLARLGMPLAEIAVLDAGCGTGAYSQAVVGLVGRVEALDMSRGMLAAAEAELAAELEQGRIAFHRGAIDDLPFEDASLDAVMINQVLHHLDDSHDAGFPAHRRVFAEFARVLRPGGGLVFNVCTHEQLNDAYWYYHLIPEAAAAMRRRYVPIEHLRDMIGDAGFDWRASFAPVDAVCQGQTYFDGRGPLEKAWRDGDSVWALAGADELGRALERVRALDAAGTLDAFVAEHDARRAAIGQITFAFATRADRG